MTLKRLQKCPRNTPKLRLHAPRQRWRRTHGVALLTLTHRAMSTQFRALAVTLSAARPDRRWQIGSDSRAVPRRADNHSRGHRSRAAGPPGPHEDSWGERRGERRGPHCTPGQTQSQGAGPERGKEDRGRRGANSSRGHVLTERTSVGGRATLAISRLHLAHRLSEVSPHM